MIMNRKNKKMRDKRERILINRKSEKERKCKR